MLYRAEKNICFCGGTQFQDLNAQKLQLAGDLLAFKCRTLKVKHSSTKRGKFSCREKADSKCPMEASFIRQNSHDNC